MIAVMKCVIQIPCFNEASSLPGVLASLPRALDGFSQIEVLVVDDGSQDASAAVAVENGADEVLQLPRHVGLAQGFYAGLKAALARGADVIINLDADGQYHPGDLPALVRPILEGRAEMVLGDRSRGLRGQISPYKYALLRTGSWVVSLASGLAIPDAASGLRAFSRAAAEQIRVHSRYSYTLETLIQAGALGWRVISLPVMVNPVLRPSRLVQSTGQYLLFSAAAILQAYGRYRLGWGGKERL